MAFDPWDPYRDLRFAGTREHPAYGTCFIAEGRILVEDLLAAGRAGQLKVVSVAATTTAALDLQGRLPADTELLTMEPAALSELAGFPFHRGLMACAQVPAPPPAEALHAARRLLVLPRLYDSENLGLLLRSAAALGLDGVLAGPGPGQWTRRTVRVSMGAVWRIPVWRVEDPWERLADWKTAEPGSEVVAAALTEAAEDARLWQPAARCALVMGPEDTGLEPAQLARCDRAVAIAMASGMDSLNVAAAGAILMFRMTEFR
ncbi:MAG: RNA methyltransferase [Geothrix sp.]|uniref:TrmH family RNA methyltransferase n=1 Tax=Geothrix sp. TaxID=1962974 RepID=UPI0017A71134|nr:RNA methyltransferase [Geothrix sp.]NWJ42569.1 RNA methyltransferase [Geothrix sp.]WIL19471.1 MAG: RNA methyltransferase [Geothrix sp.]